MDVSKLVAEIYLHVPAILTYIHTKRCIWALFIGKYVCERTEFWRQHTETDPHLLYRVMGMNCVTFSADSKQHAESAWEIM